MPLLSNLSSGNLEMDVNKVLMRGARGAAPITGKRRRARGSQGDRAKLLSSGSADAKARRSGAFSSPGTSSCKSQSTLRFSSEAKEGAEPRAAPQQTYIDVGQRGFGARETCRACGLMYTAGEEEDEKEHAAFCKWVQRGIVLAKWKSERLHKQFPDEDARIIEIRAEDPAAHVKKLLEVKELLDDALGFVERDEFLRRGVFLYVADKRVVGCVTVESISRATPMPANDDASVASVASSTGPTEAKAEADTSKPAFMGVCQIWVHPLFRRQKIATRLLDVARDKFIYGLRVPSNGLAFAQPSIDGLSLARAYASPHQVLVYDKAL